MTDTFPIHPAQIRSLWLLGLVALILVGVFALLLWSFLGARNARFELTDRGLAIHGDLYGRTIPYAELDIAGAHRVDWGEEAGLRPGWRTVGTGLPGYQAGWFKLKNGSKALLYVTDHHKAIYIPTSRDYGLLLSPNRPDAFLEALRRRS